MFTASGLVVRFLKVFEPSGYNSVKWVRYLTKASGSYQIRVCGTLYLNYCFRLQLILSMLAVLILLCLSYLYLTAKEGRHLYTIYHKRLLKSWKYLNLGL